MTSSTVQQISLSGRIFRSIGTFVVRWKYLVILAWALITIAAVLFLPSLSNVASSDNSSFLPSTAPVIKADKLTKALVNTKYAESIIVAARNSPLTAADKLALSALVQRVKGVSTVHGVTEFGTSADGEAVQYIVLTNFSSTNNSGIVSTIRKAMYAEPLPSGLQAYLTGPFASTADAQSGTDATLHRTQVFSVLFILVLLVIVFRSVITPIITLIPAVLAILISGPVIAEASKLGLSVSDIMQIMLSVLLLGAGTDYGVFLIFRTREELWNGQNHDDAVIRAVERVGESITFSALTVIIALLTLILASFSLYSGLGPGLAIGVFIMLLLGLTLLPALLALFGTIGFWPSKPHLPSATPRKSFWERVALPIVKHPLPTLLIGIVLFGGLAIGVIGYFPSGFTSSSGASGTTDSQRGATLLAEHFPAAEANPTTLVFRFPYSLWNSPNVLGTTTNIIAKSPLFTSVNGALNPNGTLLTPAKISAFYALFGPPQDLTPQRIQETLASLANTHPHLTVGTPVSMSFSEPELIAYATLRTFISKDGHTVVFQTALKAGDPNGTAARKAVPSIRSFTSHVAQTVGATANGVAGISPLNYDISATADSDLVHIIPIVLVAIAILLGFVLRSLIAPLYLIVSVALSYFAAFGLANLIFNTLGGKGGLNFILPFIMFIFLMALGEDYNILLMTRIREEAATKPLKTAVVDALKAMGSSITSAGLILAGTFGVFGLLGSSEIQQIGLGVAFGVLMDTFLVRTLLVPSAVTLLRRWNWWPASHGVDA